jgi:hypothetical protein
MANLTVAHLPFGQANKWPAGMNQRVGILAQQAVISGLARQRDRIRFSLGTVTPAIEDDEYEWFGTGHWFGVIGSESLAEEFLFQLRAFDVQVIRHVRKDCAECPNSQGLVVRHCHVMHITAMV